MTKEVTGANEPVGGDKLAQLMLLLSTPEGTVPLDRSFGINTNIIDMPNRAAAQNLIAADLADKIERYIPGLVLKEVSLQEVAGGEIKLKVVVEDA